MYRTLKELYPDYSAELKELNENGFSLELLYKIIRKHRYNSEYNKKLYERYMGIADSVPIMSREPRYSEDEINNKLCCDYFGKIVNFKTGFFAGNPIAYGYSDSEESEETSGGINGVESATKRVTDFVTRNSMYGVDMEITKLSSIYGYVGRLFFIDNDGEERTMVTHSYETIILSSTNISEPEYSVRYFCTKDINGSSTWTVEFYDNVNVRTLTGGVLNQLNEVSCEPHMFDYCPLQGIPNNREMLGDAEKVISLIDDYNKTLSDNSNEIESFVHAQMVVENLDTDDETNKAMQKSGVISFNSIGTREGKVYYLTKNINDAFTEHHLERLEKKIYDLSDTPNLNDEHFGNASGISLEFKLHGLRTKCNMYKAQMLTAGQYMWKVLASAWAKKGTIVDPLQVTMDIVPNIPVDTLAEAQKVQALIAAGIPKEIAFGQLSFIDDIDYVMQLIEEEMNNIPDLENENIDVDETDEDETTEEKLK